MAYTRKFQKNTNFNSQGNWNNNGFRGNSQNQASQPKKHSGCTVTKTEKGDFLVSGWKLSKGQMISLYARPYKNTHITTSKEGKKWQNLFVTLVNKTTLQETKTSGLFDMDSKKLYIKSLNLIANPKGGRGGYFGKHISSNY
jgi:hypothetical protein